MRFRARAIDKNGGKAGVKRMAMASTAPKRIGMTKKSAPAKKAAPARPARKTAPAKVKKAAAKKAAPAKKPTAAARPPQAQPSKAAVAPKLATPVQNAAPAAAKPAAAPARPAAAPARPAGAQSTDERRKAATRKFFARLRSLEAIVGADLRKRGSVVLMQAVDQWYSEAINANATDVSITNAAKVVIAHL